MNGVLAAWALKTGPFGQEDEWPGGGLQMVRWTWVDGY